MERHPLDLVSLTAGLIFTAAAAIGLSGALTLTLGDLRWIGPVLLVVFGIVLVATSVSRRGDGQTSNPTEPERTAVSAPGDGSR